MLRNCCNDFSHTENGEFVLISRALASLIGIILFLYGVIAAISPLPLCVVLMVFGFLIFAGANPFARPLLRRMRKRWSWFDALVRHVGKRSSGRFEDVVKDTDPTHSTVNKNQTPPPPSHKD